METLKKIAERGESVSVYLRGRGEYWDIKITGIDEHGIILAQEGTKRVFIPWTSINVIHYEGKAAEKA